MDIRRIAIIVGLVITSYLLIYTWNSDYGQVADDNAPLVEQGTEAVTATDLPSVTAASSADQPVIDSVAVQLPNSDPATGNQLITVETDVLLVRINPKGGEISEVQLKAYPASIDDPNVPFVLMENNQRRTYIAQSGLIGRDGIDNEGGALFNSDTSSLQLIEGQDSVQLLLNAERNGVLFTKEFTFRRGDYLIDVNYRINNQSTETWQGALYAQLKRDGSQDPSSTTAMGMQSYLGTAVTTPQDRYKKISFDDLEEQSFKQNVEGGWAALLQHYFVAAWVPNAEQAHTYNGRYVRGNYLIGFYDAPINLASGDSTVLGAQLYVGPKIQSRLAEISDNLELTIDYGWLWWIAQPLFWLLDFIHDYVSNWGIAIILLTVVIKALFFKLSATSYRSMANMRKVAPKMQAIKERYGDNREKLGQEMMKLYRDEKINPLGGCLPILVQMPVFIALYWVLMESVELRQAPFFLWIKDMSVMDPYFILPLIMGASMFIQMKLNPTPPDPMQARVMQFMPVIFTIFFLWFPAGLVLYWVVNNILSIAQQYVITRNVENA